MILAFALVMLAAVALNAANPSDKVQRILNIAGLMVGAVVAGHTLYKEYGTEAQRMRQLKVAKTRLAVWEMRARLESTILSGRESETRKRVTQEAIEDVWADTNNNLARLARRAPIPVIGLPWWRRALLLYKPLKVKGLPRAESFVGYAMRAIYMGAILLSASCVVVPIWATYLSI